MEKLHDFHLRLCRYVRDNVAEHLDEAAISHRVRRLKGGDRLETYLRSGIDEPGTSSIDLLLNQKELTVLASLFEPLAWKNAKTWMSFPALHKRATTCVIEIRKTLTTADAEQWGDDSSRLRKKLEQKALSLEHGILAVAEWTREICHYMEAAGRWNLVPQPKGDHLTPTNAQSKEFKESKGKEEFEKDQTNKNCLKKLREAIKECGNSAKASAIVDKAKVNRQKGYECLHYLTACGEYDGLGESKAKQKLK